MAPLRFVDQGEFGLPRKRKTAAQACDICRKRKKRCSHLDGSIAQKGSPPPSNDSQEPDSHADSTPVQASPAASHDVASPTIEKSSDPSRGAQDAPDRHWIGDMAPEGVLLAASSPDALKRGDQLGFWVSSPRSGTQVHSKLSLRQPRSNKLHFADPMIQQLLLPYLEDHVLSLLPPEADLAVLSRLYKARVHPLFPVIIDEASFNAQKTGDPASILVKQAICLAVCKEREAAPHLKLPPDLMAVQPLEDFAQRITTAMRQIIDLGLVTDKRILIQVYCLMSLFVDNTDSDLLAQYSARAVNHLHSLAIQILGCASGLSGVPANATPADASSTTGSIKAPPSPNSRLFCCCWLVDRLNACLHGRAVLMHERDWTRDLNHSIASQEPCFQLFLRIIKIFDSIIDFYRPGNRQALKGWEHDFPDFEQLVVESDASRVDMPLLALLETIYHSVSILSHRQRSMDYASRSSPSFLRRTHSAGRITTIVGEEFKNQLPAFPLVAHAVSLSISVGYSELRASKVPLHQARARNQLLCNCKILKSIGRGSWSALAIAEMAEQLVHEVDKAVSAATGNPGARNNQEDGNVSGSAGADAQPTPESINGDVGYLGANHAFSDSTFPAGLDDFDVFDHFDPQFDLAAVDSAFTGNLDLSFPISFNIT